MPFDSPFSRSLEITHLTVSERCACPRASRQSRERCRGNLISLAGFFSFFQIGSGAYPLTPVIGGGGRVGFSAVLQLGRKFQNWGPIGLSKFNWHAASIPGKGRKWNQFDNGQNVQSMR